MCMSACACLCAGQLAYSSPALRAELNIPDSALAHDAEPRREFLVPVKVMVDDEFWKSEHGLRMQVRLCKDVKLVAGKCGETRVF